MTNVLVIRVQNIDYPYHGSVRQTMRELFRFDTFRIFYMGMAPVMVGAAILMGSFSAAIFANKLYMADVRMQEKREFFKSIDWTQPEKIKDEDVVSKSPERQVYYYLRRAICPLIMLFGVLAAHPFYVISMHVVNYRYNGPLVTTSAS